MSATHTHHTLQPEQCGCTECCADANCAAGRRNNYFLGKRLSPHTFQVEQQYALERRRLLNRAMYGTCVVYGFGFGKGQNGKRTIGAGLALDVMGRELLQVEDLPLELSTLIVLDQD